MRRWSTEVRKGGWRYKVRGVAPDNQGVNFTIHRLGNDRWRVVGNASSGARLKYRFDASSLEDALREAERILGYPPPETAISLKPDDVFTRWLESRNCSPKTQRDYRNYIASFLGWIDKRGDLPQFSEIRLEHLQAYANHLHREGYAQDSIRLYLFPLVSTFRWAAANWPGEIQDVSVGLQKPRQARTKYKADVAPSLTFREVCEFLDFLEDPEKAPEGYKIILGVALQGLAGLRLTEVLRLTHDKLVKDTLTVEGVVKNSASIRRIPLPALVLDLISEYRNSIIDRFTTYMDLTAYSKAVSSHLVAWGSEISPRELRRTIPTEFRVRGFHGWTTERYLGHAVSTVTDRHYVALAEGKSIQLMRDQVVRPINRTLRTLRAKRYKNGTLDNVVDLREARKCS